MILLTLIPEDSDSAILYAAIREQQTLEFSTEQPAITAQDYVVALLPASMVAFSSLPAPATWLSLKKMHRYIHQNIPDHIIYDEMLDDIIVWTTEGKELIFAVVNKERWKGWCKILESVDAIIPTWKLIPWNVSTVGTITGKLNHADLARTGKWQGHASIKNDDIGPLAINQDDIFNELEQCPLPLEINMPGNKRRRSTYIRYGVVGFLLTGIIFQMWQINMIHQKQKLNTSTETAVIKKPHDRFSPIFQTLDKVSDNIQFRMTSLHYNNGKSYISLTSYNSCEKLITELDKYNKSISVKKSQTLTGNQKCSAELEISS